ncbi:MAG: alkaline phosphatase family protein [Planctomycetes bacterium]|nr:alkaline phosphatase family protein [Planctomycetota bacterium]
MTPVVPPATRLLVCTLDACAWPLLQQLATAGRLPTIATLLARGARATLASTAEQLPDSAWASLCTGRNPAAFARYFPVQYDPVTGDLRCAGEHELTGSPFWTTLADAGLRVGVFDPPNPGPAPAADFLVAHWPLAGRRGPRGSSPPELLPALDRRFGRPAHGTLEPAPRSPRGRRALGARLIAAVELRGRVLEHLLTTRGWDVAVVGVGELHAAGHALWPADDGRDGGELAAVYVAVDALLGRLLELAGPDCLTLVVSAHGMGPPRAGSRDLQHMLDLLGFGPRPARRTDGRPPQEAGAAARLAALAPGALRRAAGRALPGRLRRELHFRWHAGRRDWVGWRAHAVPNDDAVGAIRLALRGRDRHGSIEPRQVPELLGELEQSLRELTDPASGRPVVRSLARPHELFAGPYTDALPDLTACWEYGFAWRAVHSPRFGTLPVGPRGDRAGDHTADAFLLAHGPGVAAGDELAGSSILDVAPTILAACGLPPPATCEGAPIQLAPAVAAAPA